MHLRLPSFSLVAATVLAACLQPALAQSPAPSSASASAVATVPGMPPLVDRNNLYSEINSGKMSPAVAGALELGAIHGVELPIAEQVRAVVFDQLPPFAAVAELMSRSSKDELEG